MRDKVGEDPLLGRQLGNYRLVERIGDGAYGEVYRAEHVQLKVSYAAKVLHPTFMQHETALKRFRREAETTGRLKHENIVSVSDFDVDPKVGPYLIMEFLEGETLGELMKREGALPLSRVYSIARPICKALGAAHAAGVIHRDLKPDNIFLAARQQGEVVKVLDFGIARLTEGGESLTGVGQTLGTPEYMSPEQCRGLPLSTRSDIYCFGILLFQMLSGKLPFAGTDAHQVMVHHLISPVPRLDSSFAEELRELLFQLMAKMPSGRPQEMDEVWLRLSPLLPKPSSQTSPGVPPLDVALDADTSTNDTMLALGEPLEYAGPATMEQPALGHENDAHVAVERLAVPDDSSPDVPQPVDSSIILLVNKKDDLTPTMVMDAPPEESGAGFEDGLGNSDTMMSEFVGRGHEPMADLGTFEHGLLASLEKTGDSLPQIKGDAAHKQVDQMADAVLAIRRWVSIAIVVPDGVTFASIFREGLESGQLFLPTEEPLGEGESLQFCFEDLEGAVWAQGSAEVLSVTWPGERGPAGMSLLISACAFAAVGG